MSRWKMFRIEADGSVSLVDCDCELCKPEPADNRCLICGEDHGDMPCPQITAVCTCQDQQRWCGFCLARIAAQNADPQNTFPEKEFYCDCGQKPCQCKALSDWHARAAKKAQRNQQPGRIRWVDGGKYHTWTKFDEPDATGIHRAVDRLCDDRLMSYGMQEYQP